jgi:arabinofuranan 3-O-arabinosyltransferase
VDANSTDTTVDIAEKYHAKVIRSSASRSAARNIGMSGSEGKYLLFLDSDMELTPNVVSECVEVTSKQNLDAVMIPEIRVGDGFWARCRALERATYVGDSLIESARFFPRKSILSIGGFDEDLEAGEDWDLQARMDDKNSRVGSIRVPMMHHEGKLTLRRLVQKRYFYGKTILKYVRKHRVRARTQYLPVRLNYLRHWRLLASNPLHAVGMVFMRMVEYYSVIISICVSYRSSPDTQ